jgi:prepilin-type N-terminal cleavage/methylation domain-containing protein
MEETAMKAAIKRGFTIVELLVVITIIGILMAMLFPALNTARTAARRVQCLNRQKQVGQGIITYSTLKDLYPGWREKIQPDTGEAFDANWVVRILPNIEQASLYDKIKDNKALLEADPMTAAVDARLPRIEALICPANPPVSKFKPVLGYVVNAGIPGGEDLASKATGVFFDRGKAITNPVKMRPTFVSGADGTSNTLLLSETLHHRVWNNLNDSEYGNSNLSEAGVALVWDSGYSGTLASVKEAQADADRAHRVPSSRHPGVVMMTFCDGRTKAISENIQYDVYRRLMTSDGKETISEEMLEP